MDAYHPQWQVLKQIYPGLDQDGSTGRYLRWEVVDPERWVPDGFVVIQVDSRGTGKSPGFLDPFSPQTESHRKHAQAMLDQIHTQFIDVVKKGRGDRLKETPELFSGLFWSGQQAIELGLADQLGNLDFVAREVVKAEDIVDYTRRENVAERLVKRFGASIGEGAIHALKTIPAVR